jgi:sugar phosphate isomerase/epimerase
MSKYTSRRDFLKQSAAATMALAAFPRLARAAGKRNFKISLAAWSLHKTIGTEPGKTPMLDLPQIARNEFGIEGVELVSPMMASTEPAYLEQFAKNAADNNVKILLIMIDGQGDVGSRSENIRQKCVENHSKWIDIASNFGCHSIRMNWGGAPKDAMTNPAAMDEFMARSVPGFRALCEYGDKKNINVLLENHWGPSSYPEVVTRLAKAIDHPRFGTLPDFGNFPEDVDKYQAVDTLMNYAKAVSAKCYDFDDATGEETKIDFEKMLEIVCDKHGYDHYIGIEFEGPRLSEYAGTHAAKTLLEKLRG